MARKLAIVGLEAQFGFSDTLEKVSANLYEGIQSWGMFPDRNSISDLLTKISEQALRDYQQGLEEKKLEKVALITAEKSLVQKEHPVLNDLMSLWQFSGVDFNLDNETDCLLKALEIAQILLSAEEVDVVVISGVNILKELDSPGDKLRLSYDEKAQKTPRGEAAAGVVLKDYEKAQKNGDRIYAVIESFIRLPHLTSTEIFKQSCQKALAEAGCQPSDIGYLEVTGHEVEIQALTDIYSQINSPVNCAVGSVKANIGDTGIVGGLASLIKTVFCLYHRYIPGTPNWLSPKHPEIWKTSSFYIAGDSRPWFISSEQEKRIAAINLLTEEGGYGHVILSEEVTQQNRPNTYLQQAPFYLFPLADSSKEGLETQLDELVSKIENSFSLSQTAREIFRLFQRNKDADYALVIVGDSQNKILKEIEKARKGINEAFALEKPWKSPLGSYFTPKPLARKGKVAFVYPGGYSAHRGMGRKLFHLFPKLHDRLTKFINNPGESLQEKLLYPRSLHQLSLRELEALEVQFSDSYAAMLETGSIFSVLFTEIMREYFQLQPEIAFGYSMGESTMMYSLDVWYSGNHASNFIRSTPLFNSRLLGLQETVSQYWGIQPTSENKKLWNNHVLMTSVDDVRTYLQKEKQVYLTQINTPKEVVIAGDPQGCLRVIEALQCDTFRYPVDVAIHCEAMSSEYSELIKLYSLPLHHLPKITFYSSANYAPIPLEQDSVTQHLAQGLCQQLDFPRLVNRVYDDGARIFLELGAGGSCARWISEILDDQEHLSLCINRRGVDDLVSIIKVLAQLVSHRVSLDLSPLYSSISETLISNSFNFIESEHLTSSVNLVVEEKELVACAKTTSLLSTQPAPPPLASIELKTDNFNLKSYDDDFNQPNPIKPVQTRKNTDLFNRENILEFIEGKVSKVFGKDYEAIDQYSRRVRIPSPPFMFISRVNQIEGQIGNYKSGFIETELDLAESDWYTVDGQIPLGICLEAGHGILMLLSYVGTDFENQGQRSFRLLDISSTFFDEQPANLKKLKYKDRLISCVKTKNSLLVFFEAEVLIEDRVWFKIHNCCAGLFSDEELQQGEGIVISESEKKAISQIKKQKFTPLLTCNKEKFDFENILQLSQGNLAACFGENYQQNGLNPSLRFPSPKLIMIDNIMMVNPQGGMAELGLVIASKTVTPDDWYFSCHFKNDPTMPGNLMIEGAVQTLQFYCLYLGLQTSTQNACFQVIPTQTTSTRFRGQVTPQSGTLIYQMEVIEIGLTPQPFVIANVQIIFGGKTISLIKNLGFQLSEKKSQKLALFDSPQIKEFAEGSIVNCLGKDFDIYQNRRFVRLPKEEFCLVTRVLEIEGKRHELQNISKIITEYEVSSEEWYYRDNSYPYLPYCTYIEIAGQPCIFLGVYLGTTLLFKDEELYFRNLDGQGIILKEIDLRGKTITDEVKMISSTAIKGAIIQKFEFQLSCDGEPFYQGNMVFGYFSPSVLANQVGLDKGKRVRPWYQDNRFSHLSHWIINLNHPEIKDKFYQFNSQKPHYRLGENYLDLLDEVFLIEESGLYQKGYIYAKKTISPQDWYFAYHFYQDPVMPGALGVESILQAMQVYALQLDLGKAFKSPRFAQATHHQISWKYRGQITPENREMSLEVHLSDIRFEPDKITLVGDASLWKEDLRIYEIKDIAICLMES